MKVSDLIFLYVAFIIGVCVGIAVGINSKKKEAMPDQEIVSEQSPKEKMEVPEAEWDRIKDFGFEIDMEKMGVILVKRSFNNGDEVTLIQYENGTKDHFVCSREIHHRLVVQFQDLLKKRKAEDF